MREEERAAVEFHFYQIITVSATAPPSQYDNHGGWFPYKVKTGA